MKAVTERNVYLPRIVPVKAAEGQAIVQQNTPVGDVEGSQSYRSLLAESLPECKIDGGVPR